MLETSKNVENFCYYVILLKDVYICRKMAISRIVWIDYRADWL